MALFKNLFRTPKHQRYDYKPRYWDEEKELLEKRLKRIEMLQQDGAEAMKARIASGMRRGYLADKGYRRKQVRKSNLLLLGIMIVLIVSVLLFLYEILPELSQFMGGDSPVSN